MNRLHIHVAECPPQSSLTDIAEALQTLPQREWVFDEKSSSFVTYWLVEGVSRPVLVFRSETSLDGVAKELKAMKGFRIGSDIPWHIVLPREWSFDQASEYRGRVCKKQVKFVVAIGIHNPDGTHRWVDPNKPATATGPVSLPEPSVGSAPLPKPASGPVSSPETTIGGDLEARLDIFRNAPAITELEAKKEYASGNLPASEDANFEAWDQVLAGVMKASAGMADANLAMAEKVRQARQEALAREEALAKEKIYANMEFSDSEED